MKITGHSKESEAGFTLVETIVAFAVISIVLAMAVRGISTSLHNAERSRIQEEMRQIARAVLAENGWNSASSTQNRTGVDGLYVWELSTGPVTITSASDIRVITLEIKHKASPALTTKYVTFERSD